MTHDSHTALHCLIRVSWLRSLVNMVNRYISNYSPSHSQDTNSALNSACLVTMMAVWWSAVCQVPGVSSAPCQLLTMIIQATQIINQAGANRSSALTPTKSGWTQGYKVDWAGLFSELPALVYIQLCPVITLSPTVLSSLYSSQLLDQIKMTKYSLSCRSYGRAAPVSRGYFLKLNSIIITLAWDQASAVHNCDFKRCNHKIVANLYFAAILHGQPTWDRLAVCSPQSAASVSIKSWPKIIARLYPWNFALSFEGTKSKS